MSQASSSGFEQQVLLTEHDISKAELRDLSLVNCPFCKDHPQLAACVSGQPKSMGAHFVACWRCDKMVEKKMRCPFFKWLSDYAKFLLDKDIYADNSLLRKIQALQREKENGKLLENQVTSPWNVNYQQGSKVPRMNNA